MSRKGLISWVPFQVTGYHVAPYHPKLDRVPRLFLRKGFFPLCTCLLLLLLVCVDLASQVVAAGNQKSLHGSISTVLGLPASATVVELWDLHGEKKASGVTDRTGNFDIAGSLEPGEYVLLVDSGCHVTSRQVRLEDPDLQINLVLPSREASRVVSGYTVPSKQIVVPGESRAHLRAADRNFRRMKFGEAMTEVDNALGVDPEYALALAMRAFIWLAEKDPSRASEDAQLAVSLDPGVPDAFVALAVSYNSLGEFNDAELAAEHALALRPDSWQARLELAKSFYHRSDFVVALRELDLTKTDFPDAHVVRANVLLALGRKKEARDEFRTFLRKAPSDPRRQQVESIIAGLGEFSIHGSLSNF